MKKLFKDKLVYVVCAMMLLAILCPSIAVYARQKEEEQNKASKEDIVTIIANDKDLSTLAQALKAAGLEETLKQAGPYTVFAPTNEAFQKLPNGTLDELLKPENKDKLVDVLTYHVFPGKVTSVDAAKLAGKEVTMNNNKKVKISEKNGNLYINDAKIIKKDMVGKNGVIHVIDVVLVPEK